MKQAFIYLVIAVGGLLIGALVFSTHTNTIKETVNTIGAGAHSQTVKQAITADITTLVPTTTILNSDSGARIIDKIVYFVSTTNGSPVAWAHFAYASNTLYAGTDLSVSSSIANNAPTSIVSSTLSLGGANSVWSSGTYLMCYSSVPVSSTAGFCAVDYYAP